MALYEEAPGELVREADDLVKWHLTDPAQPVRSCHAGDVNWIIDKAPVASAETARASRAVPRR
jgi:hypothetical protein